MQTLTHERMGARTAAAVLGQTNVEREIEIVGPGAGNRTFYQVTFEGRRTGSRDVDPADFTIGDDGGAGIVAFASDIWIGTGAVTVTIPDAREAPAENLNPSSVEVVIDGASQGTVRVGSSRTFEVVETREQVSGQSCSSTGTVRPDGTLDIEANFRNEAASPIAFDLEWEVGGRTVATSTGQRLSGQTTETFSVSVTPQDNSTLAALFPDSGGESFRVNVSAISDGSIIAGVECGDVLLQTPQQQPQPDGDAQFSLAAIPTSVLAIGVGVPFLILLLGALA